MSQYVLIKDNQITNYYDSIPSSLGNEISGFDKFSDLERESFGFYTVEQRVATFNPDIHNIIRAEHILENGKPVYIVEVENKYSENEALEIKINTFLSKLRAHRDYLLSKTDWLMTADIIEQKGQDFYNAWKDYRQALRNLPNQDFSGINWEYDLVHFPAEPTL